MDGYARRMGKTEMIASLAVPPAYREALRDLANLDEAASQQVVANVAALPAYSAVPEIDAAVREALDESHRDDAGSIVASLLSVRGQLRGSSTDEIAGALSRSPHLELDTESRDRLRGRVSELLQSAAFSTTSVAVDLQTQHERNYQSARILTDLRPVFGDDLEANPSGAVIVEVLQLQTWTRSGESDAVFVAMDEHDLVQLQGVVERALKKTETLRGFLEQHGLTYFELDKGEP